MRQRMTALAISIRDNELIEEVPLALAITLLKSLLILQLLW
jgi:hypothetical protein